MGSTNARRLIRLGLAFAITGVIALGATAPARADQSAELAALKEQLKTASQTLDQAKADLKAKQDAVGQVNTLKNEGTAGFFKYVGATGAYKILTDPAVSGKLSAAISLGSPDDATNLANMDATIQYMKKCNDLRRAEGKSELQVSDTLMAVAQADTDWSSTHTEHALLFSVGENLSWNAADPFQGWYTQEKANHEFNNAHPDQPHMQDGHYLNIINGSYAITGFAIHRNSQNRYGGNTYGQTFSFGNQGGLTRSGINPDMTGSRTRSIDDYVADIRSYQAFLAAPTANLSVAQQAVETAQRSYNGILARIQALASQQPQPNHTSQAGRPPQQASHGALPSSTAASHATPNYRNVADPMAGQSLPGHVPSATGRLGLARTGANVFGVAAIGVGLCMAAGGALTLRSQTARHKA
ncbi:CAP domain-containing protein [Bifidobacterium xylocopae]|uniref:SCP domain-containing protein n=1 Tax=Bifidobacterium xylocopae TaxID=2493119 RepID=A0A366KHE5_9BIFI|nr:CAP domain-containing protein [Bifidobacterium xylocopae]RBQ00112.1 hypothetical protein CRD59_01245 [Bifidobacterium xylocopae]